MFTSEPPDGARKQQSRKRFSGCKVPLIETERLRMRGHHPGDFTNSARLWGDPAVTRYIGGKPLSPEDVWARLLRYVGHWSWLGFGYWVVEEKTSGQYVGEVGFADHKRQIEPALGDIPEIGWVLVPAMQGKGYATESARAAINWGAELFGSVRTVCLIAPENLASIRVATKCGYEEVQRATYRGDPAILFSRDGGVIKADH